MTTRAAGEETYPGVTSLEEATAEYVRLMEADDLGGSSEALLLRLWPGANADYPNAEKVSDDLPSFAIDRLAKPDVPVVQAELVANEKLKVWDVPVDLIDPDPSNPNEQDDDTFNMLAEEIDEANEGSPGFIEPIHLVRLKDRFQIIGGEHRWRAVKATGGKTIPAIILDGAKWTSEEFREFMLMRLNQLRGTLNPEKFIKLYKKYEQTYGNEKLQRLFAFTDKDYWQQLTGGAKQSLRDMGASDEMLAEFDDKTKEIKTVDDLAGILNGLFQRYGNDLRFNFMVFAFGGKEHLMIRMDAEMAGHMEAVKRYCRDTKMDINEVMKPIVARFKESVETEAPAPVKKKKTK